MKDYILVKNNVVENVIHADLVFTQTLTGYDHIIESSNPDITPGWVYNPLTNTFSNPIITVIPIADTKISKLQFQLKFTFNELVAIEAASATNPALRVLQNQQQAAEYIDTADPTTQLGIMYLVSVGLLTHERGLQVLGLS